MNRKINKFLEDVQVLRWTFYVFTLDVGRFTPVGYILSRPDTSVGVSGLGLFRMAFACGRRLGSRLSMGYAVGQNCTLTICIETIFVNFILVSCNMRLSVGT